MCNIVCYALGAGATIEQVEVNYADGATAPSEYGAELVRPNFDDEKSVSHDRIDPPRRRLRTRRDRRLLRARRPRRLLHPRRGRDLRGRDSAVPRRRAPPLDLVDDVGRAYGFDNLEPRYPDVGTVGGRHERSRLEDAVRTSLVGLGFEDLLNFHMTSGTENYDRMNLEAGSDAFGGGNPVEITEP